jgi:cytochrome b561
MALRNSLLRYGVVAMTFHWVIALAVIFNIWFGDYVHAMADDDPNHFEYVQIHKSIGITVLVLALLRLLWRIFDPPPPLPASMPKWQVWASRLSHWALYGLIIAIPLAGWALVSSSPLGLPTFWFGLFEWPHIPFISDLPRSEKSALRPQFFQVHSILATVLIYVLAVHVLAALQHHFLAKDAVLKRMVPGTRVE